MKAKLPAAVIAHRELAYRRALRATGHQPTSVEIMVAKDRDWLDTGIDKPDQKA